MNVVLFIKRAHFTLPSERLKVKALQEMLVLISKPINFQLPFFLTQAAVTCPVSLVST